MHETLSAARIAPDIASAATHIAFADLESAEFGLQRQQQLAEQLGSENERRFLVWRAPQALITGRSDSRLPDFSRAEDCLRDEGWPVLIRRSGGTACPISRGTLQIALASIIVPGVTIDAAYLELASFIGSVLKSYGLEAEIGEKPRAFCPGRYDISVNGRKIAGLSQHWRRCNGRSTVTTAATLIVDGDPAKLARITNLFYQSAGGQARYDPSAIGSLGSALQQSSLPGHSGAGETGLSLVEDIRLRMKAMCDGRTGAEN